MILAVLQARMSSVRLPGKVLLPIGGKPILQWVIEAARAAKLVDSVVVVTSSEDSDLPISEYCLEHHIPHRAGSLNDVLDRYYRTAIYYKPSHIVRLTADCPMSDPEIIDLVITDHLIRDNDYTTNSGFPGCYPDGQDVEVFTMDTLTRAAKLAVDPYEREHLTLYMRNAEMFKVRRVYCPEPTDKKFSVDTRDDYERVKEEMEECLLNRRNCSSAH